ncbi:hypothetical protein ACLESO_33300 [Pyxidicoccus sp. 3LG]
MHVHRNPVAATRARRQPDGASASPEAAEPAESRGRAPAPPAWERSSFEPGGPVPQPRCTKVSSPVVHAPEPPRLEVVHPEADPLDGVGSGLPASNGPQLLWTGRNPAVVGGITELARRQGRLSDEKLHQNSGLARQTLPGEEPRRVSTRELVDLAKQSGVALEKLDPNQAAQAACFISLATSASEQRERLTWSLSNLQMVAADNLPRLSREEQVELLWAAAEIPRHSLSKLSDKELSSSFQELARATNSPGESRIAVGEHEVRLKVGADGWLQESETKRPSALSRLGGALGDVGSGGLQVLLDVTHVVTEPVVSMVRGDPTTGLTPAYDQLSERQRDLLGAGGRRIYDSLPSLQRGGLLLLTQRMDTLGIDYSGLHIKGGSGGIEQARLKLDGTPEALARLRRSFEDALRDGRFLFEAPSGVFHAGENDTGGRENRADYSLQLGIGPEGAFVDIDRYNPLVGKGAEHFFLEVLIGGNTVNPFDAARYLGEDLGPRASRS